MYSRDEASKIKEVFWTKFGKYMQPVLSAEGEKINWINYKTGIRSLAFKMNVTEKEVYFGIEIAHKDEVSAHKLYELFESMKTVFEEQVGVAWKWEPVAENEYRQPLSRISIVKTELNIFKESDWPGIISFLKPQLILLDMFWCDHKMIFEMNV